MSPTPALPAVHVAPAQEVAKLPARIVTALLFNALLRAAPVILPAVAEMVKSKGSISHAPVLPVLALVLMLAVSAIFTFAAEVSM